MKTLWWYISSRYTIICVIIAIRLSHRKVIYWSTGNPTIFFPQTIVWFVNKNFATTDELAIHMKEEHSQVCGICEETFATRSKLVKPVQSNHSIRCNCCKIVTNPIEKMGEHEDDHYRILCNLYCFNLPTKIFCKSKQYQSL